MSSFYGTNIMGSGDSSSFNYDDIQNTPIKNITGATANQFINLAGLDTGHYNLKGYYKIDSQSDLEQTVNGFELVVRMDSVSSKKTIHFFTIEEEILYSNLLVYEDSVLKQVKRVPINDEKSNEIYWAEISLIES